MTYVGTCGYAYKEWKDAFYPPNLRQEEYLSYYATVFPAVEIDSTFYRMPTPFLLSRFVQRAPTLRFAIKAPRTLTHQVEDFDGDSLAFSQALDVMASLGNLGAILFQFPQSFHYTKENRVYLERLLRNFEPFPRVVEFRHKEWGRESVWKGLDERRCGFCVVDEPSLSALPYMMPIATGDIGYIRFHGRNASSWYLGGNERYSYLYDDDELKKTVPILREIESKCKETMVFFNNHPAGGATINARTMMSILGI